MNEQLKAKMKARASLADCSGTGISYSWRADEAEARAQGLSIKVAGSRKDWIPLGKAATPKSKLSLGKSEALIQGMWMFAWMQWKSSICIFPEASWPPETAHFFLSEACAPHSPENGLEVSTLEDNMWPHQDLPHFPS